MKVALFSKEHDVTAFASTDARRPALENVHYNAAGGFLEACNGSLLIRVPVTVSEEFPDVTGANGTPLPDCVLPLAPFKKALGSIPAKPFMAIAGNVALTAVEGVNEKIRLTVNDGDTEQSAIVKKVDANYPNTEVAIPKEEPTFSITLSALQLKAVVDYAHRHATEASTEGIRFDFVTDLHAVRWSVSTNGGRNVTGLIMPVRTS